MACWLAFLAFFTPVLVAILNTLPNTLAPIENKPLPLRRILLLRAIVTICLFEVLCFKSFLLFSWPETLFQERIKQLFPLSTEQFEGTVFWRYEPFSPPFCVMIIDQFPYLRYQPRYH